MRPLVFVIVLAAAAIPSLPGGAHAGGPNPGGLSPGDLGKILDENGITDPEQRDELTNRAFEVISKIPPNLKGAQRTDYIIKNTDDADLKSLVYGALMAQEQGAARAATPTPQTPREHPGSGPLNKIDPDLHPAAPNLPGGWDNVLGLAHDQWTRKPNDPGANRDLGSMYYTAHNWQGAYDRFHDAYGAGSRDPQMVASMAGAAYELGDYTTAARAAKMALQLDPSNREAMTIYQFSKDRVPKVNLPSSFPDFPTDRDAGAIAAGGGTSASSQQAALPSGVVVPPPSGMTAQQAADLAKQAAAGGPGVLVRSNQFTKDAANALRVKDYPTAYQLATEAITLNPQNAQALNFRAMSSSQMRRYSDAVQDASSALGLAPGSAAVLQTRSWAFAKQGKYKEALQDAETTLSADPRNAFAYENKAFALAGLGDRNGALDSLQRAAALDNRFENRLERAVQMPKDADLTLLFDDGAAQPAPSMAATPAVGSTPRRFARLAVLSATGGLLIALGVLHIVSASWREKMRMTVRRVLGPSPVSSSDSAVADSPSMGAFWTQYEVVKEIGLGGMGVVYEATDRSLERRVAVKKMRDEIRLDPADRQRFVAEARMVAQLHHPNIVDIYAIVEDANDVYLVFEFVEGRTLGDALKSGGPMDLPRAARVIREMAAAVAHAHERNIIHRDLKPSNVMLTAEGRVKVMDFGVARQAKDAMTRHSMTNTVAGTPPYMAPEQEQGTVRKESDVYALGVCLYEMTTGVLPFNGVGAGMLLNKLNGKWIPPSQRSSSLPSTFDAVIARALAPDPDKRYHTPAELVAALDSLITATHA
jgi:tetratricopeptide (TPR) repeat protein/predicted Ser/Thr protein kinase